MPTWTSRWVASGARLLQPLAELRRHNSRDRLALRRKQERRSAALHGTGSRTCRFQGALLRITMARVACSGCSCVLGRLMCYCIAEARRAKAATASSSILWCILSLGPCARYVDERGACVCACLTRQKHRSGLRGVKASRCQSCRGQQHPRRLHLHAHRHPSRLLPVRVC